MFQCIIQQRNGWIHQPSPEYRDVFPGNMFSKATIAKCTRFVCEFILFEIVVELNTFLIIHNDHFIASSPNRTIQLFLIDRMSTFTVEIVNVDLVIILILICVHQGYFFYIVFFVLQLFSVEYVCYAGNG